jgi:ribosomal protein S6--L-glutamate ligase
MGLRIAGVDLLEGAEGPLVMEVNSSPGLQGIETATGLDIAGAMIDYIGNQVAFPELDIRQRLTVSTGYGVAELHVREGAEVLGESLGTLRDRDITVLTLQRGTTVIPNPKDDRVLEVNDRLLCFGRLDAMRGLVPQRRRRTRVKKLPNPPSRTGPGS